VSTVDLVHRQQVVREHPVVCLVLVLVALIGPVKRPRSLSVTWLIDVAAPHAYPPLKWPKSEKTDKIEAAESVERSAIPKLMLEFYVFGGQMAFHIKYV